MAQFFDIHPDNPQARLLAQAAKLLKEGGNIYRASMAIPLVEVGYAIVTTADDFLNGKGKGDVIVPLELVTEKSPRADVYLDQQGAN